MKLGQPIERLKDRSILSEENAGSPGPGNGEPEGAAKHKDCVAQAQDHIDGDVVRRALRRVGRGEVKVLANLVRGRPILGCGAFG